MWNNRSLRQIFCLVLISVLLFSACSTNSATYQTNDFLGKTASEITARYGPFDCIEMPVCEDGLYRNTACGYTIQEANAGFLGKEPETLFFIEFDENGIAIRCYEGYRPGG